MDDFRRLDVELQLERIRCERDGMIAENMQRTACGHSMAYTMENFQVLITQLEHLRDVIRG